jgi:phosphatidylinositol alpha-1,6-mannosyltransferase
MQRTYVLGVSTTWPPMAAGSGRAFKELVSGVEDLVVLAPRVDGVVEDAPCVRRVLRFSGRCGGPFKIYSALQHLEAALAPLVWSAISEEGRPALTVCSITLFAGFGGWLLYLLRGVPYIVHALGEELTGPLESGSFFRVRYRLTRLVLSRAAAVICISHFTWRVAREEYGVSQDRLHTILPTLDISERQVDLTDMSVFKQGLVGSSKMVLMVGRLQQERKGFDRAIDALSLILAREPDTKLVIVGPGDQTYLRSLAHQAGVEDHVRFVGEVERDRLMLLYAVCDVFLLPTRTIDGDIEGFGIVFLEANLMGKPVVGGRTGGTEDAVIHGKTGLLVDGHDIHQIAEAVIRLLGDPAYADLLGRQGRERVLQEFDSRIQQRGFVRIVEQIV